MSIVDKMYIKIVGVTPLLLHNGRTSNPLDPYSKKLKALTSKRNKTDEDIETLLAVQWEAALYWDDEIGLYMPSENFFAAFHKASKKHKLGTKCSGLSFPNHLGYPIITENHKDLNALRNDINNKFIKTVTVQKSKTISCRPIFNNWRINFDLEFDKEMYDANEIKTLLMTLSNRIGLGVWTPGSPKPGSHGKFLIESMIWEDCKSGETKEIRGF